MREPKTKLWLSIGLFLVGAAAGVYGWIEAGRIGGERPETLVPMIVGGTIALLALVGGLYAARAVRGEARLRSGRDRVARWWVSAADWSRFRAFDDAREEFAQSAMKFQAETRPDGIEILVGTRELMADGSLHVFHGGLSLANVRNVCWLDSAPACIELVWTEIRDNGDVLTTIRLPVPEAARAEGQRAFDYFSAMVAQGDPEYVVKRFKYDRGARVPEGFEAGSRIDVPTEFPNRDRLKAKNIGYGVGTLAAVVAGFVWFMIASGVMAGPLAEAIGVAATLVAILTLAATAIITRRPSP